MLRKHDAELQHYPRLTRFYGIGPDELSKTPRPIIRLYLESLPELIAEEQLLAIQAATYPHAEEADRKRTHRQLMRLVSTADDAETIDPHSVDHIDKLRAMGIKVVDADA